MEESAALSRRLSAHETENLQRCFAEKAATQSQQADLLRNILLYGSTFAPKDVK